MNLNQGLIFDIRKFSLHDGPGIRTTVFFKGCPLSCQWCHNPESQSFQPEIMFWESRCIQCGTCFGHCPEEAIIPVKDQDGRIQYPTDRNLCTQCGECVAVCPTSARELIGRCMSVTDVMNTIERDRTFYEESGGGVTFSGGEPLAQPAFLGDLLRACKKMDIHTAVDTSGYAAWDILEKIHPQVDLFLYDLKLMDDNRHRQYTGVSNRRILENLRALAECGVAIVIRFPLIPGINDDMENLCQLGEFLSALPGLDRLDVLPYHPSALGKYERLALSYSLPNMVSPSDERVLETVQILERYRLNVKIGG